MGQCYSVSKKESTSEQDKENGIQSEKRNVFGDKNQKEDQNQLLKIDEISVRLDLNKDQNQTNQMNQNINQQLQLPISPQLDVQQEISQNKSWFQNIFQQQQKNSAEPAQNQLHDLQKKQDDVTVTKSQNDQNNKWFGWFSQAQNQQDQINQKINDAVAQGDELQKQLQQANTQAEQMIPTEYQNQYKDIKNLALADDAKNQLQQKALNQADAYVPDEYKNQYSQIKDIALSDNATAKITQKTLENSEAYVPQQYQAQFQTMKTVVLSENQSKEAQKLIVGQADQFVPTEYQGQYNTLKNLALSDDPKAAAKNLAVEQVDQIVPNEYKDQYNVLKTIALSDDPTGAAKTFVPQEYQGYLHQAEYAIAQAQELKRQKDEYQIGLFLNAIHPLWATVDTEQKGYIDQDKCCQLIKILLEQQKHGELYNDQIFHTVLQKVTEGTDGKLKERQVAEMANYIIFQGF